MCSMHGTAEAQWTHRPDWFQNVQDVGAGAAAAPGGGCTHAMHGRSHRTIDPRIPPKSGRSGTSGFHRPGTNTACTKREERRGVPGGSHEGVSCILPRTASNNRFVRWNGGEGHF